MQIDLSEGRGESSHDPKAEQKLSVQNGKIKKGQFNTIWCP